MFGLCALSRTYFKALGAALLRGRCLRALFAFPLQIIIVFLCLIPQITRAQTAQKATVVLDGALVYQDADFDAPVIATLKLGEVYDISRAKKGPFHKIRIKPGTVGWVADVDVKPGIIKIKPPEKEKKERRKKPFFAARYRGPTFDYINFTEDTLGEERSAGMLFYGVKFNGFNTLMEGEIYTEGNILFHIGAPQYYSDYTKKGADGFIVMANFLFQTVLPQSKSMLFYYGFGPMFKYSHFSLEVPNGTQTLNYSADDMNLGVVFNVGLAFRLGESLSLRTDAKYYWERSRYYGLGLNLGWEF